MNVELTPSTPPVPVQERPSWRLSLVVMVVAFVAYFPTLPQRTSLWGAELAVRTCGWEWRPILQQPVLYLFQQLFHALPLPLRPQAVNVANLALACVVLGLLARAIQLWPRDRTPDLRTWQLQRLGFLPAGGLEWFAPLAAVLGLGLTLNFWRQATSATGDMLDCLLLAGVTVCLLEYRIRPRRRWLWQMSLLYGLGMANDWAFTGLLPVFLAGFAGLLGWRNLLGQLAMTLNPLVSQPREPAPTPMIPYALGLLDWRPVWVVICGILAGFSTILILPLTHWLSAGDHLTFWECIRAAFLWQRSGLSSISDLISRDGLAIVLALSSLVPLFLVTIRWQDQETSYYTVSYWFTGKAFWMMHGALALLSGWILLGAVIGPANILLEQSFLPHYFMCALVLGASMNYLMRRVLGRTPADAESGLPWTPRARRLRVGIVLLLLLALGADTTFMVVRNAPVIRLVNRQLPGDFQAWILAPLPRGPKVLLADDSNVLNLARLLLLDSPGGTDIVCLDTAFASRPQYHQQQMALYPPVWRTAIGSLTNGELLRPTALDHLLNDLAVTRPVFYLHPSEMHPYDHFRVESHGFVHALYQRATNHAAALAPAPPFGPADEAAWSQFRTNLLPRLTNAIADLGPSLKNVKSPTGLPRFFDLPPPRDFTVAFFARFYSLTADARGVELQRAGRWAEAAAEFQYATALNPYNASARANLDYNQRRRAGQDKVDLGPDPATEGFENYDTIEQAVKTCGPIDDPVFRVMLADSCSQATLYYQAIGQYERVLQLNPADWGCRFLLADLEIRAGRAADALALAADTRAALAEHGQAGAYNENLALIESRCNLALHHKAEAIAAMNRAINAAHADARLMMEAVGQLWADHLTDQARDLTDLLAAQHPDRPAVFILRGFVHLELDEPAQAERDFARALELNPTNELARYKHGCTLVQLRRYDEARAELKTMLQHTAYAFPAHYALAQIALAQGDTPDARVELKAYLQQAATNAPDYHHALDQLAGLR